MPRKFQSVTKYDRRDRRFKRRLIRVVDFIILDGEDITTITMRETGTIYAVRAIVNFGRENTIASGNQALSLVSANLTLTKSGGVNSLLVDSGTTQLETDPGLLPIGQGILGQGAGSPPVHFDEKFRWRRKVVENDVITFTAENFGIVGSGTIQMHAYIQIWIALD